MIISSSLNNLISVEKQVSGVDEIGASANQYSSLFTTFANVYHRSGSLTNAADSQIPVTTVEFTIRYKSEIDYDCRIKCDDDYYKILHIEKIGRKEGLKITTVTLTYNG